MRQHHFSSNVEYNPLRAIITRLEDGAKVVFDIIPASDWQEENQEGLEAWDVSQNYAWSVAEGIEECLEAGDAYIEQGAATIWAVARERWYPDDQEVELAEAEREWEGMK